MRGQMELPTPLTVAWDSNLCKLQNAYSKSPTPLLKCVGFAMEINHEDWEAGRCTGCCCDC